LPTFATSTRVKRLEATNPRARCEIGGVRNSYEFMVDLTIDNLRNLSWIERHMLGVVVEEKLQVIFRNRATSVNTAFRTTLPGKRKAQERVSIKCVGTPGPKETCACLDEKTKSAVISSRMCK
jgi:hypothetical protein